MRCFEGDREERRYHLRNKQDNKFNAYIQSQVAVLCGDSYSGWRVTQKTELVFFAYTAAQTVCGRTGGGLGKVMMEKMT